MAASTQSRSTTTRASPPHYVSPDSAPADYAVRRSVRVGAAFLVALATLSAALVPALPALTTWYADLLGFLAEEPGWRLLPPEPTISFRPFFALLLLLLAAFALGSPAQRLRAGALSLSLYAVATVAVDVVVVRLGTTWPAAPLTGSGGIAPGLAGVAVTAVSVFACYHLPADVKVRRQLRPSRLRLLVVLLCVLTAGLAVAVFVVLKRLHFEEFRIRFVGGLDSEVVLFLLLVVVLMFVLSRIMLRHAPPLRHALSVAFLIPAHNEQEQIAETIAAIDVAAGHHRGPCRLYIVDNASSDRTAAVASAALAACRHLSGRVLSCPTPGKSAALNAGLAEVAEEVVVRIDADTLVEPNVIERTTRWFLDPQVGGVSGVPLPKRDAPRWLYPLRVIEVHYGVAFLRVAQGGADAVMVMPGLIASYRRRVLEQLGGFGEGFNGEDADITMRIGRLGYSIVTDPSVQVRTEVPQTIAHLREQRQRWARGLWHMAARNRSSIAMRQGVRCLWVLPWSILNGARRTLMIPILTTVLVVELLDPSVFALREVSVIAGFLVGLQLIIILLLLVARREFRAIPFIPAYVVFRMFRAYVTFECLLTLRLKERGPRPAVAPIAALDPPLAA